MALGNRLYQARFDEVEVEVAGATFAPGAAFCTKNRYRSA
jgi:hypothetical protein